MAMRSVEALRSRARLYISTTPWPTLSSGSIEPHIRVRKVRDTACTVDISNGPFSDFANQTSSISSVLSLFQTIVWLRMP